LYVCEIICSGVGKVRVKNILLGGGIKRDAMLERGDAAGCARRDCQQRMRERVYLHRGSGGNKAGKIRDLY